MGAPMSQFDQDVLEVVHAIAAVEDLMKEMGVTRPPLEMWKVPGENSTLVDIAAGVWIKTEGSAFTRKDGTNAVADWIALFNPSVVDGFLQMMKDHVQGLQELRFHNPELADQLSVSRTVLGVARRLQSYVVSEAEVNSDGERMSPERRLGVVEW